MNPRLLAARLLFCLGLAAAPAGLAAAADRWPDAAGVRLIVSPDGPYTTIAAALAEAADGDTVEVHGGVYPALVVEKSVSLRGVGWPVIDGGGRGTVVVLSAPGASFGGFEVRRSGDDPDRDHAGITITAAGVAVENNRLRDVLFGVFVSQADSAVVRGNDISSKAGYDTGRRGDGVRVWYSRDVVIEDNHIHEARDVVLWYSGDVVLRANTIQNGRYGVHLMYCDGAQVEANTLRNNSVGLYTMYSSHVVLRGNLIRGQRGPSGYALGFKDADFVDVVDNVLVDNRAGVFVDGTPFSPAGQGTFARNILAYNDVGVILLTAVRGNRFEDNTFWENVEQVALQGGGRPGENAWRSNYWSDYAGFDLDQDGLGDSPYAAERFFESLVDREPILRALLYSPAAQTLEFAAASFPIIRPQPKLVDPAPRMTPARIPAGAMAARQPGAPMLLLGLALSAGGLACAFVMRAGPGPRRTSTAGHPKNASNPSSLERPMPDSLLPDLALRVEELSKRYGAAVVLDRISMAVRPGESLALWGANGAGKTTLMKALLGLIHFQGSVQIQGWDLARAGKAARRRIGYVPQEAAFYDMSLESTLAFYARLKGVAPDRIHELLEQLGLAGHARKPVPALSGGLKQRLALAVALLADPPILLLDEPTANLDAAARRDYLRLLATLRRQGKTLILATHRVEEVEVLADRVMMLEAGRVAETLSADHLRLRLAPDVELTLWVVEAERLRALSAFQSRGWSAHLNGRGTVVVRVGAEHKLQPLALLMQQGIAVQNFEMECGQ
jgi:nitrous oxidase accessory protein